MNHMTSSQRDAYVEFVMRLAARAGTRMKAHLLSGVEMIRNPWGFE